MKIHEEAKQFRRNKVADALQKDKFDSMDRVAIRFWAETYGDEAW